MEAIHSFGCPVFFSPCLTGRASSTTLLPLFLCPFAHTPPNLPLPPPYTPLSRSLRLQVHSITISFPFVSFFSNPLSPENYASLTLPKVNLPAKYLGIEYLCFGLEKPREVRENLKHVRFEMLPTPATRGFIINKKIVRNKGRDLRFTSLTKKRDVKTMECLNRSCSIEFVESEIFS